MIGRYTGVGTTKVVARVARSVQGQLLCSCQGQPSAGVRMLSAGWRPTQARGVPPSASPMRFLTAAVPTVNGAAVRARWMSSGADSDGGAEFDAPAEGDEAGSKPQRRLKKHPPLPRVEHLPMYSEASFESLGMPAHAVGKLSRAGFLRPMAVQQASVPTSITPVPVASRDKFPKGKGKGPRKGSIAPTHMPPDMILHAETGSGKTLSYLLPILAQVFRPKDKKLQAVIVVPTRELAIQVEAVAQQLFKQSKKQVRRNEPGKVVVRRLVGKVTGRMRGSLRYDPPHVVVGTPQTIATLLGSADLPLEAAKVLVLDEADYLADPFVVSATRKILETANGVVHRPQIMFVSATSTPLLEELAKEFMHKPKRIDFTKGAFTLPSSLTHYCIRCRYESQRKATIPRILATLRPTASLTFTTSAAEALELGDYLRNKNVRVAELVNDMANRDRGRALKRLTSGLVQMLVSTDMMARGLDIPRLSHVLNTHPPKSAREYLHRAGRVGRQGRGGCVVTIACSDAEQKHVQDMMASLGVPNRVVKFDSGHLVPA